MPSDELLKTILVHTYTKTDMLRRLEVLGDYFDGVRFGGEPSASLADGLAAHGALPADVQAIAAWGEKVLGALKEGGAIAQCKQQIEKIPELMLYVPIQLAPDAVQRIGGWVRENVDPQALIALHIDSRYIGGCALAWKDSFFDYSLGYWMHKQEAKLKSLFEYLEAESPGAQKGAPALRSGNTVPVSSAL